MATRTEADSMGTMEVPAEAYFGAQTRRAELNFQISPLRFPRPMVRAMGLIKKAAAQVNMDLGLLDPRLGELIVQAAQAVADGRHDDQFVVDVFQTGSGTSTNMNANEVIAGIANEKVNDGARGGKSPVHPNDAVNMGQSSNDVIPTAIHVAALEAIRRRLMPALEDLQRALEAKAEDFDAIVKIGRTHLQDAVPIRLGQEFSGYAAQVERGLKRLEAASDALAELAIGGTAVGTGINTHAEFPARMAARLARETGLPFRPAANTFEAMANRDAAVEASGALKTVAISLSNVANNLRWLASGPRCGIAEVRLPELQPGSSIMPGKVNPVIPEAVLMVAAQVVGNDATIAWANALGSNFDLNVMMPVLAYNLLQSIELLANAAGHLDAKCVAGIQADEGRCRELIERSLAMCTALAPPDRLRRRRRRGQDGVCHRAERPRGRPRAGRQDARGSRLHAPGARQVGRRAPGPGPGRRRAPGDPRSPRPDRPRDRRRRVGRRLIGSWRRGPDRTGSNRRRRPMLDDHDFALDDHLDPPGPDTSPAELESGAAVRPVVIVEYRRRRLLLDLTPPALLLLLAVLVFSYRERLEDWPGLYAFATPDRTVAMPPPPVASTPESDPVPEPGPAPVPIEPTETEEAVTPVATTPTPEPGPETKTEPETEPEESRPPDPEPDPSPEVAPPVVVAQAVPPPIRGEDAWAEIRRAAELEHARRERLARMTPVWVEQERALADRRRREEVLELRRAIEGDRPAFHDELRRILQARGEDQSRAIEQLSFQHGRSAPPDAADEAHRAIENRFAWLGRNDRIRRLRGFGVPEAWILDYLRHRESRNILARDGPRDEAEALVRAAGQLIAVPPPRPSATTSPRPATPRPPVEAGAGPGPPPPTAVYRFP